MEQFMCIVVSAEEVSISCSNWNESIRSNPWNSNKKDIEVSIFPEFVAGIYSFPFPDLRMKYEAMKF